MSTAPATAIGVKVRKPSPMWDERLVELVDLVERERGLDFMHALPVRFLSERQLKRAIARGQGELSRQDRAGLERSAGLWARWDPSKTGRYCFKVPARSTDGPGVSFDTDRCIADRAAFEPDVRAFASSAIRHLKKGDVFTSRIERVEAACGGSATPAVAPPKT